VANHLVQIDANWANKATHALPDQVSLRLTPPGHDPAVNGEHTRFWYLFFAPQQLSKKKGNSPERSKNRSLAHIFLRLGKTEH
jgi:hypothetical protein